MLETSSVRLASLTAQVDSTAAERDLNRDKLIEAREEVARLTACMAASRRDHATAIEVEEDAARVRVNTAIKERHQMAMELDQALREGAAWRGEKSGYEDAITAHKLAFLEADKAMRLLEARRSQDTAKIRELERGRERDARGLIALEMRATTAEEALSLAKRHAGSFEAHCAHLENRGQLLKQDHARVVREAQEYYINYYHIWTYVL